MPQLIEDHVPVVQYAQGIYTQYDITTTGNIYAANVTSITNNLDLSGTLNVDGATTLNGAVTIDDNVTISGTLGVDGVLALGGSNAIALDGTETNFLSGSVAGAISGTPGTLTPTHKIAVNIVGVGVRYLQVGTVA